jgi:hypothetical protein
MRCTPTFRGVLAGAGLALILAAAGETAAHPNGRFPATTNVHFEPGKTENIYLAVTFGLLKSTDGGKTFRWVCETAIGYGGVFDPDYAVSPEGNIYANTFEGVRVSRNGGCVWEQVVGLDPELFVSEVEVGPDGRVWVTSSNGGKPNDVYVSDDGTEFRSSDLPNPIGWWSSLRTTADNPMRIYVTGFVNENEAGEKEALLRRSDDGGKTWLPIEMTGPGFDFGQESSFRLLAVSPTNADVVFAHVPGIIDPVGDALYRSEDAGVTWERVFDFRNLITSFHIRPDGETVIAASTEACPGDPDPMAKGCVQISREAGAAGSWAAAAQQPRLACIGERSDGLLFGCAANFAPDNFALGSSKDGESWDKVFRFADLVGPLECDSGTEQAQCTVSSWPAVCEMLGLCDPPDAGGGPDAAVTDDDDGSEDGDDSGGCCRVGGSGDTGWVPGLLVALFLVGWRSRKRK